MENNMEVNEEITLTNQVDQMQVKKADNSQLINIDTEMTIEDQGINAEELLNWCLGHKELTVNKIPSPIEGYTLNDIRIKSRFKEDSIFLNDKEIASRIRRGNCIAEYEESGLRKYKIARKGLIKFYDYLKTYKPSKMKEENSVLDAVRRNFTEGKAMVI